MKSRLTNLLFSALCTLLAFSAVTYNSCKPDKCKAVRCAYGGVCHDGNCTCLSGYEGSECQTLVRNKFIGGWSVTETGTMTHQPSNYTISLKPGENITDIRIRNFYNIFTQDVYAIVKGDSIVINKQSIQGRTVEGYGFMVYDSQYNGPIKINMHYAVVIDSSNVIDDYGLYSQLNGIESIWLKTSN